MYLLLVECCAAGSGVSSLLKFQKYQNSNQPWSYLLEWPAGLNYMFGDQRKERMRGKRQDRDDGAAWKMSWPEGLFWR